MQINFIISEVGNFISKCGWYKIKVQCTSNNFQFQNVGEDEVAPCSNATVHKTNLVWTLVKNEEFTEDDIFELSSSKLNIGIYIVKGHVGEAASDDDQIIANCSIDLINLEPISEAFINKIKLCRPAIINSNTHWTRNPFIRYHLKSSSPLWKDIPNRDSTFHKFSISIKNILNPSDEFVGVDSIDIGIPFPKKTARGAAQTCFFNKNFDNFRITNEDKPREESNAIDFQQTFECKMLKNSLQNLAGNHKLSVEIKVNTVGDFNEKIRHMMGIMDLTKLTYVGVENLKLEVPLTVFNAIYYKKEVPKAQQVFFTDRVIVEKKNGKKNKKSQPKNETSKTIVNNEGMETLLSIEIGIVPPLIEAKKFEYYPVPYLTSALKSSSLISDYEQNSHIFGKLYLNEYLTAVSEYDRNLALRYSSEIPQNRSIYTKIENAFLQSLVSESKLIFRDPHSSLNDVEQLYIKNLTRLKESISGTYRIHIDQLKIQRLEWATELFELNLMDDAKAMHLMNIVDSPIPESSYIDYGIFNLQSGNIEKAYKCISMALENCQEESVKFLAKFLLSYIFYKISKCNECEKILLELTRECEYFVEAWMALLIINSQKTDKAAVENCKNKLKIASCFPFRAMQHDIPLCFWKRNTREKDYQLEALLNILRWGCLEYAELGFTTIDHKHSFNCLFHSAVVYYCRKNFKLVIQILRSATPKTSWQNEQKAKLALQCHVNLGKLNETLCLLKSIKPILSTDLLCTTYLKLAKVYVDLGKIRTAGFYLKMSLSIKKSYAACKLLEYVALEYGNNETAYSCARLNYEMNPVSKIDQASVIPRTI